MKLRVLSYNAQYRCHMCRYLDGSQSGREVYVDLTIDDVDAMPKGEIIGMEIECDYLQPYITIASGIKWPACDSAGREGGSNAPNLPRSEAE